MISNIIEENILYLQNWMSLNPALRENLTIENDSLVFEKNNQKESVSIKNFYLPEMLYNENFREDISSELNSEDLFQIIKIYITTNEMIEQKQKELEMYPKVIEIKVLKDANNIEFLAITDDNNKKYRYDTKNITKVLNGYEKIKSQNGYVTLKELGMVIQNAEAL